MGADRACRRRSHGTPIDMANPGMSEPLHPTARTCSLVRGGLVGEAEYIGHR
jgi:hypothetical protein